MNIKAIVFDFYGVIYTAQGIDQALVDFIHKLKPKYKLGILSNSGGTLKHFLQENGVHELFDVVVASGETPYVKPQTEIFELVANKLGLQPEEIFFIDDSAANTEAAAEYGMQTFLYTSCDKLEESLKSRGLL